LFSFCLHAIFLLAIFFAPRADPPRFKLDLPVINLSRVTIGSDAPPSQEQTPAAEAVEPAGDVPPVAPEEQNPAPLPVPAAMPVPEVRPEPAPEAAEKTVEPVSPGDEALLREAFADARRAASPQPKLSGGRSVLDQALADALAEAKKTGSGGVFSGEKGDGFGYKGVYLESVISRIRPHFITRPRSDGKVFEMTARLEIADDGSISKITVLKPSGDGIFDANVLRAIRAAGKMEPPLSRAVRRLDITFNSQLLTGR
jgi:protein TonB